MPGETDLDVLLASMEPRLLEHDFVFLSFPDSKYGQLSELRPIAMFMESEGMTLVVPKTNADEAKLPYESVFRCITLMIHSSLDAVGLTAAFANKLKDVHISANVIAGYYHDHIFVQRDKAHDALAALKTFQSS